MTDVSEKEIIELKKEKISKIQKLTNILLDIPNDPIEKNLPLTNHAHFLHKFSDFNIKWSDIIPVYFIKDHISNINDKSFAIVTEIKKKSNNEITIVRKHIYNNYYNEQLASEKISIRRNEKKGELVFKSFREDKFKKEVITIDSDGLYSKLVKFKYFKTPKEFLFFQNIYYFKCMEEAYTYYKVLNKIPNKQDLVLKELKYYDFIKNFL